MDEAAVTSRVVESLSTCDSTTNRKHLLQELILLDPTGAGGGNIGTGQAPIPENKDLQEGYKMDKDNKQVLSQLKHW